MKLKATVKALQYLEHCCSTCMSPYSPFEAPENFARSQETWIILLVSFYPPVLREVLNLETDDSRVGKVTSEEGMELHTSW